jgi:hypothetical protein
MKYKLYTTDGSEFIATSLQPVKNNAGTGYRVETEINGQEVIMFYKADEITTITQVKE